MKATKKAKTISVSNGKTSPISVPPSHATRQLLIDIDNLTVELGNEPVLESVSLCIHSGEFIGIIGPNGAGKTTLLKVMLGLLRPTRGTVRRTDVSVSYIPQNSNTYNGLVPISVLEVAMLGSAGSAELARQSLDTVGLAKLAGRRFAELSGGQQQRVAIAKALAANADILILDEPTAGIDDRSRAEFYAMLHTLHTRGITVVLVAHEIETVLDQVDRLVCLSRAITYDGTPAAFDAQQHLPDFYKRQHQALHHGGRHA